MVKRKVQQFIDSDEESDASDTFSASDKKNETKPAAKSASKSRRLSSSRSPKILSDSDSDSEREEVVRKTKKPRVSTKNLSDSSSGSSSASSGDSSSNDSDTNKSELDEQSENLSAVVPPQLHSEVTSDKSDLEEGQISDEKEQNSGSEASEASEDSDFDDGFDEDFMGDEEDRNRLERLSEKERETEIFKRAERRDQLKRRWEIERKIKLSRKAEGLKTFKKPKPEKQKVAVKKVAHEKQRKPSPSSSNTVQNEDSNSPSSANSQIFPSTSQLDDEFLGDDKFNEFQNEPFDPKERSKERKKNVEMKVDKRTNAMALLKMKREVKLKREEEESKRKAQNKVDDEKEELDGLAASKSSVKLKSSEIYSDDSSNDSEREEHHFQQSRPSKRSSHSDKKSQSTSHSSGSKKKPTFISTVDEMNKLRISRHKLEKFINLPTFEKTVVGCFVRINIGNNNSSQKLVYRVAEITAVLETPKVYLFGKSRTNKGLRLRHGTQERVFRLEFISNQDFTVAEFNKWKDICNQYSVVFPQLDLIEQKKIEIDVALSYEFREEDVNRILIEKERFRAHPTNYAMKKTDLMKERDAAQLRGEDESANDITNQIQELEERANELDKRRSTSISLISYINDRNRKMNIEEAEKAIIEEVRANKGKKFSDPFTRRLTKPKMAFKAFAPSNDDDDLMMAPEAPKLYKPKEKKKEENTPAESMYSLHNFDIELNVDLDDAPALSKPIEQKTNPLPSKRSLNLEDYKKRRGLI